MDQAGCLCHRDTETLAEILKSGHTDGEKLAEWISPRSINAVAASVHLTSRLGGDWVHVQRLGAPVDCIAAIGCSTSRCRCGWVIVYCDAVAV